MDMLLFVTELKCRTADVMLDASLEFVFLFICWTAADLYYTCYVRIYIENPLFCTENTLFSEKNMHMY